MDNWGGYTYLYKEAIKSLVSRYRWAWLCGCVFLTVGWYFIPNDDAGITMIKNLILFLPWLMYTISVDIPFLRNRVMKYLSGISLELYLAQMVIFRAVEKLNGLYMLGYGWLSFTIAWITVVAGLIGFIEIWKRIYFQIRKS